MPETTARATIDIRASKGDVWRALTDPDRIREYYMGGATVETDWKVGSPIRFTGEWNGQTFEDKGEVVTFDPDNEVAYSHFSPMTGKPDEPENYHTLRFELDETPEGTLVTLDQDNNPTAEAARHSSDNWDAMLRGVRTIAEREAGYAP